jgi:hypothetical protein
VLIVPLHDQDSELAKGLREARNPTSDAPPMSIRTPRATAPLEAVMTTRNTVPIALAPSRTSGRIPPALLHLPCHVVPIRKLSQETLLGRVSVGRAHHHDILLAHKSVSKLHGYFELHDNGDLFIGDAGSSNHTFVNGKQIQREQVQPGTKVQFGSVETYVYSTESVWNSFRK